MQAQTPTTIRFAVIGDYGSDSDNEAAVAAMINSWDPVPDLIITAGDNRYGSRKFDDVVGQYFCDRLADVQSGSNCAGGDATTNAFFPSLGNHDFSDGGGINEYLSYFNLLGAGAASTNS